jgi:pimeloyl-ACP methyl ester carboxylesterase
LEIYRRCWLLAISGALNTYAHPAMLLSDSFRRSRTAMARCTAQSLFGSYQMIRQANLSQRLAYLQPPTLVITGAKDRVVPPDQASLVAQRAPRAELVIIPGAGHLPMDEQPDLFNVAIKKYLQLSGAVKEEGRS